MILPKNIVWNQNNRSDRFGDLWSSFNLDLVSKYGSLKISPRLLLNISTTDDAQLDAPPCAFRFFTATTSTVSYLWAIAGNFAWYSTGGSNTAFVQDDTGTTPTACNSDTSDMEIYNATLFVTQAATGVKYLSAGAVWTNIAGGVANSSGLHQMTYFRATDRLYIVDDNARSISVINGTTPTNATASTQYTLKNLVDGTNTKISWIKSNSNRIFIGTINTSGQPAKVYAWDGSTGGGGTFGPNEEYTLTTNGSLSCVIKDDVPNIIDVRGRLLQFNGGTFVELDRLPFDEKIPTTYFASATGRLVHYNGMSLVDGKINILVNSTLYDTNSTNKENVPSGVWEYTKETGLYHKASIGHTKAAGSIVEYGQQKLSLVGALTEVFTPTNGIAQGSINGTYLVGCKYYTTATVTLNGIFYDDTNNTLQKAGCLITSKIFSQNVTDTWQKFYLRIRKFLNATDKVVVKYRMGEDEPTEATITYSSTTTFTVPIAPFTTAPVVGDEVEIIQGVGAGRTAHITVITTGAPNYNITVDETITGATTQTAKARFQTWKKIASYNAQTDDFIKFPITEGNVSTWIQFKVWILWTGKNEIHDMIISNKTNEKIE